MKALVCALMLLLTASTANGQTLKVIRVVGPPNDGYKAVYYGVRAGIFRKYGLDVQPSIVAPGAMLFVAHSPTMTLVLRDSPIRTGRDMNGKTLGSSSLRDINSAATLAWIDKTGGDSKTVRVVEVPASAGAAFLEEHRVDAVTLNEPAVSQALATGKVRILV